MTLYRWAQLYALAALACTTRPPDGTSPSAKSAQGGRPRPVWPAAPAALTAILPDEAPPFSAATPIQRGPGFFRRAYLRDHKRVEITIAAFGREPGAYERWLTNSANYPQATLPLPPARANGFFTCASDAEAAACDLHIQLRAGFHVEAMGNGQVPQAVLTELVNHLRLGEVSDAAMVAL